MVWSEPKPCTGNQHLQVNLILKRFTLNQFFAGSTIRTAQFSLGSCKHRKRRPLLSVGNHRWRKKNKDSWNVRQVLSSLMVKTRKSQQVRLTGWLMKPGTTSQDVCRINLTQRHLRGESSSKWTVSGMSKIWSPKYLSRPLPAVRVLK